MISEMFAIGNIILSVGTILTIRAVIKNRNNLKGYTFIGSILTVIPIGMFLFNYLMMRNWIALGFGLVTFIYWLIVTVYIFLGWCKK